MEEETVNGISWEETAADIIDQAVKEVESGIQEDQVLDNASHSIGEFYKDHASGDSSDGRISEIVADVIAEISDVFDSREDAVESLLSGISDDEIKEEIVTRMEDIMADMSVEATGSFGSLEFDAAGEVISINEDRGSADVSGLSDLDIEALINDLEIHMDNVTADPEFQDLLSGEDINDMEAFPEENTDQAVDAGLAFQDDLSAGNLDLENEIYDPIGMD